MYQCINDQCSMYQCMMAMGNAHSSLIQLFSTVSSRKWKRQSPHSITHNHKRSATVLATSSLLVPRQPVHLRSDLKYIYIFVEADG